MLHVARCGSYNANSLTENSAKFLDSKGSQMTIHDWLDGLTAIVRSDLPDMTNRQMAILLTVAMTAEPHTVRGLAARLDVSKPVVTRALNKLAALGYLLRKRDRNDGRNIFVEMTKAGTEFLEQFNQTVGDAAIRADAA
jgi:DNA-binding MarR family transcriptional regulator